MSSLSAAFACMVLAVGAAAHSHHGEESYDFVIVGGGLAGSILANRLSASGRHSVLLLNVAGAPAKAYSGPVMVTDEFIIHTNITADDGLRARIQQPGYAPVPHFSTELTGSSPARMLGGSSLVGLSLYLRDHPEALDSWGEGWSWEKLKPYFHRAEGMQGTPKALRESDYGQKGPYTVQQLPAYVHPLTKEFIRAAEATGLAWAPDLNTERGAGVGLTPTTQRADGSKVHAYDAYLQPALSRPNLEVRHGMRADRLIIEDHICHGVAFRNLAAGTDHVVRAHKEVILSSGYIYSPRLLFLSGLGAKEDLEAVGLKVVKDLPAVGRHLTAARFSPLSWRTETPTLSEMMGAPISRAGLSANPAAYGSAVLEATARTRSATGVRADPEAKRPDIVLSFVPLFYAPNSAPLQYSLQGEPWPLKTNAYSILATLGETKAQGSVTFPSGAPDVSPVVTHEPMTDPEDLARASEAVHLARQIGGAAQFNETSAAIDNGAGAPSMWTAVYDGRGTCRMGTKHHDSVVDHKLRVHGISKLRVVDGSVIPVGSPYLAVPEVLALAERAADMLLNRDDEPSCQGFNVSANGHVTIADLSSKLGSGFSMIEGVEYLSSAQGEGLTEAFVPKPTTAQWLSVSALAMGLGMLAATVGFLKTRRQNAVPEARETAYAALAA